jgi:hypothetical protein
MWRALYASYNNNKAEEEFFNRLVGRSYRLFEKSPTNIYYEIFADIDHALGVLPVRNYYMVNNIKRKQGYIFKYTSGDGDTSAKKVQDPTKVIEYKHFDGSITMKLPLNKLHKVPQLPYLYERVVKKNPNDAKDKKENKSNDKANDKAADKANSNANVLQ